MLVRNVSLETSWLTAALLGSVALGAALAFGIGGREVAGQLLSQAYDKGQQNKDQVKQDMQTGKARGQQQANQAKDKAQARLDDDPERTRPAPPAGVRMTNNPKSQ